MSAQFSPSNVVRHLVDGTHDGVAGLGERGQGLDGSSCSFSIDLETLSHKHEWEEQMETLSAKEAELHQSQVRILREQTLSYMKDVALLRQDVAALKSSQSDVEFSCKAAMGKVLESQTVLAEHVQAIEGLLRDTTGRCDRHGKDVTDLFDHHTSVAIRMDELEKIFREAVDKHAKEMASLCQTQDRHFRVMESVKGNVDELYVLPGRLEHLEVYWAASADENKRTVGQLRGEHQTFQVTLNDVKSKAEQSLRLAVDKATESQNFASERVNAMEGTWADFATRHDRNVSELLTFQSFATSRIDGLEWALSEAVDKSLKQQVSGLALAQERTQRDAEMVKASVDELMALPGRLETLEADRRMLADLRDQQGKLHGTLNDLKMKNEQSLRAALDRVMESHDSMVERVVSLETSFSDSTTSIDRHARGVEDLRAAVTALAPILGRLGDLERALGVSADSHKKGIGDLKDWHDQLQLALNEVRLEVAQQSAMPRRFEQLERVVTGSLEKQAQELQRLKEASMGHDLLHDRVSSVDKLALDCDRLNGEIQALKEASGKMVQAQSKQSSQLEVLRDLPRLEVRMGDRLDSIEAIVCDACERSATDVQALKEVFARHAKDVAGLKSGSALHVTLADRLSQLEKALGDATAGQFEELAGLRLAQSNHEEVLARHAKDVAGLKSGSALHVTLADRLSQLEKALGDATAGQFEELAGLRLAQSNHEERVAEVDQFIRDALSAQARELNTLRDADSKLGALCGRYEGDLGTLMVLQAQSGTLGERLGYLEQLLDDHAFFASLPGRLSYLEKKLGEDSDRWLKELRLLEQSRSVPSLPPPSMPTSPSNASPSRSVDDSLRVLQEITMQRLTTVNDRRHISFDGRSQRATFLHELCLKKRHFGTDYTDEPTAEWEDEGAVQPMLLDIATVFEILSAAVLELQRGGRVSATLVRSRNKNGKNVKQMVQQASMKSTTSLRSSSPTSLLQRGNSSPEAARDRTSSSASKAGAGAIEEAVSMAEHWERQLAKNRAQFVVDSLVSRGIDGASLQPRVEEGLKDCYYVEFHLGSACVVLQGF